MKPWLACAAMAALALLSGAASAQTDDHETGVPLSPGEAAGAWTLESGGRNICVVTLGQSRVGAGYSAKAAPDCGASLPGDPAAWRPTPDGMRLVTADGATVIDFGRWSNSLFVAHRSGGVDVQLRRGVSRDATP